MAPLSGESPRRRPDMSCSTPFARRQPALAISWPSSSNLTGEASALARLVGCLPAYLRPGEIRSLGSGHHNQHPNQLSLSNTNKNKQKKENKKTKKKKDQRSRRLPAYPSSRLLTGKPR